MTGRITRRTLLVSALLLGQLACLLFALLWFGAWLERGLGNLVAERILISSQMTASQIVKTTQLMGIEDTTPGSPDWERLQKLVEDSRLSFGGYLCLIDADDGELLCHPLLRTKPADATSEYDAILAEIDRENHLATSKLPPGWSRMHDGSYMLDPIALPWLNARLYVIQPEEPVRTAILAFIIRVRAIGTVVIVVVVIISALVTLVIAQRYESRMTQINRGLESQVAHRSAELLRSRDAVIFGLAKLAESRDGETGEHLERIARYTEVLARQISLAQTPGGDEKWVQTLASTAVLHDIGKVGIPDAVLRKPSALTDEERQTIEKHPLIGGETLKEIKRRWGEDPFLVTAGQVCYGHHERWDGTGYPAGLKGEAIPMAARIVALADVYDALTSERAYKDAVPHEKARQMITEASGTQFDPMVVQAFIAVEGRFREIAQAFQVEAGPDGSNEKRPSR